MWSMESKMTHPTMVSRSPLHKCLLAQLLPWAWHLPGHGAVRKAEPRPVLSQTWQGTAATCGLGLVGRVWWEQGWLGLQIKQIEPIKQQSTSQTRTETIQVRRELVYGGGHVLTSLRETSSLACITQLLLVDSQNA